MAPRPSGRRRENPGRETGRREIEKRGRGGCGTSGGEEISLAGEKKKGETRRVKNKGWKEEGFGEKKGGRGGAA